MSSEKVEEAAERYRQYSEAYDDKKLELDRHISSAIPPNGRVDYFVKKERLEAQLEKAKQQKEEAAELYKEEMKKDAQVKAAQAEAEKEMRLNGGGYEREQPSQEELEQQKAREAQWARDEEARQQERDRYKLRQELLERMEAEKKNEHTNSL